MTSEAGVALARRARAYLRLGRLSNLPTVWTSVTAAGVLSGAALDAPLVVAGVAMSLAYVAGMLLNDAFDREVDARERPERPLPRGEVSSQKVFGAGFALLAAAVALIFGLVPQPSAAWPTLLLAGSVVLYDAWHKGNPVAPVLMGACRGLVYLSVATALGAITSGVALATGAVALYTAGLTFVARRARSHAPVALFIAGICLVDGGILFAHGAWWGPGLGALGFTSTLLLQRLVRGT